MPDTWPLTLASPMLFAAAVVVLVATAAVIVMRRPALPGLSICLMVAGAVAFALAAGGLTWRAPRIGNVAVVIDVSPSTRTARYHDGAQLTSRLSQLVGRTKYTLCRMAEGISPAKLDGLAIDQTARRTVYDPPGGADAVVLFSDGQFAPPPTAPPTYFVVDPELDEPKDAGVRRLEARGDSVIAATIENQQTSRSLALTNADLAPTTTTLPLGRTVITAHAISSAAEVIATLRGRRDVWPENDALSLRLPPPPMLQHWWIGAGDPGGGWRRMSAAQLPADCAEYLAAATIVLENVAADDLTRRQLECLEQYVRDLGGGLLIVGGERAFAAGSYPGGALERLSPLASTPPRPMHHWLLLGDSSGSMAAAIGDNSRWAFAMSAMTQLIALLPPDDFISIGDFAESLRWWRGAEGGGRPARELQASFTRPRDVRPTGPTNLGAALAQIAQTADRAIPSQLLLITDAQAKIDRPDELAGRLRNANVRVHLLATDAVPAENPVRRVVERTGGSIVTESNPRQWVTSLRELLRAASPRQVEESALNVAFTDAGPALPALAVSPWNRVWVKPGATELAKGKAGDEAVPAVAAWFSGNGAVIAVAFHADARVASVLADRVALPPRDPRFTIKWDPAAHLTVMIDAADGGKSLNDLSPRLELFNDDPAAAPASTRRATLIPQTAPGRYEISIPAPARPALASVRLDGRVIDRIAVAGRYAPEFEAIGNNHAAMRELARSTGGGVIEPSQTTPIDFHWPTRRVPLAGCCSLAGAALIAAGLVRWRRS